MKGPLKSKFVIIEERRYQWWYRCSFL